MPRKAIDYSNCVMYKIVPIDPTIDFRYVGHTTNWTVRKYTHKTTCNNPSHKYHNLKLYRTIRENGGWDNFEMKIIEEYPCSSVEEALVRETQLFDELKANLNTNVPYSPPLVENQKVSEAQKRAIKKYRQKNREKVNKIGNDWYHRQRAKLEALQKIVDEFSKANGIEPMDCSKIPGAPKKDLGEIVTSEN